MVDHIKVALHPNMTRENALICAKEAVGKLLELGFSVYIDCSYKKHYNNIKGIVFGDFKRNVEECDIIIVIGGDGTILHSAQFAYCYNKPLLGINTGTLGFMASLESDELDKLSRLKTGEYVIEKRMLLSAKINSPSSSKAFNALNDIVVFKSPFAKLPDFEVSSNGITVSRIRADGMIFSTPTGSTAYALSAGGPIIEPDMECIEVTQLCAHSLFARTMIFTANKMLTLTCKTRDDEDIYISIDGENTMKMSDDKEIVITKSDKVIELIDISGSNFYKAINEKLMRPFK
ncbi:MAG: NAD(+)/NADH kinase [Clostridiales bacterium]|nr:NAD(+)/NADH kinase [Clostridiales bacterium]